MTESGCPPPIPPDPWHVALDGQSQGPFSLSDLARMAREGRINPQTLVWKEGLGQWQAAQSIPEVAGCFAPPLSAVPPPLRGAMPRPATVNPPPRSSSLPAWAILLLIAGGCLPVLAIMMAIAVPNFLEAQSRARQARARADLRTFSTALEAYYVDQRVYPAWTAEPANQILGEFSVHDQPGFRRLGDGPAAPGSLTTPVAYMTYLAEDPFAPHKGGLFSYWTPPTASRSEAAPDRNSGAGAASGAQDSFIIWSAGPDHVYDLSLNNIAKAFDPQSPDPSPFLINMTYDPSNGSTSRGDIWRTNRF